MRLELAQPELWACHRLIIKQVATLQELETWYSITDILEMNEALDALEEAQAMAYEKS